MKTKLNTGLYELSEAVKNPKPDRRKNDYFNLASWVEYPKGTRLYFEVDPGEGRWLRSLKSSGIIFTHSELFKLLEPLLVPVEMTDPEWIVANGINAGHILEKLMKEGKVNREDVMAVWFGGRNGNLRRKAEGR